MEMIEECMEMKEEFFKIVVGMRNQSYKRVAKVAHLCLVSTRSILTSSN